MRGCNDRRNRCDRRQGRAVTCPPPATALSAMPTGAHVRAGDMDGPRGRVDGRVRTGTRHSAAPGPDTRPGLPIGAFAC
jgi:hypothetical protein